MQDIDDACYYHKGDDPLYQWMFVCGDSSEHQETFARAFMDGYEVEEEPKYTVTFEGKGDQSNYRIALFGFNSHGNPCIGFSKRSNLTPVCKDEMLTELEIKSYDERLWPFAVPVEKV